MKISIILSACVLICILIFGCQNASQAQNQSDKRPNIIFVMADDHAVRAVSSYGSGAGGRFFVNQDPVLTNLPQGEGMSWEYQAFYKPNSLVGLNRRVQGLRLNLMNHDPIVALGNQGSKEILTSLGRVPVGDGTVWLSTLNIIPNLYLDDTSSVVAIRLFLNLLEY